MQYAANKTRARQVVRALLLSFEKKEAVFSDTSELLENQIPKNVLPKSREHANFLFYLISQDHGVRSARLYEKAKDAYFHCPQNFDPSNIISEFASEKDPLLFDFIKSLGVRYPLMSSRIWYLNSIRLANEFAGDCRNIFFSHDTDKIIKCIRSFLGFGPKIGGLLFRVFIGVGLVELTDKRKVAFPTDIHDTRLAAFTRITNIPLDLTEKNYMAFVEQARKVWEEACEKEGIDWLQVDRALWILGSKGCIRKRHFDCPIKRYCLYGGETIL